MRMAGENYESDRRVIYVCTLQTGEIRTVAGKWDRSPDTLRWTDDGKTFYIAAEDSGTYKLFSLPADAGDDYVPEAFEHEGSVTAFAIIGKSKNVLATGSAIWSSVIYSLLRPKGKPEKLFSSNERDPELQGLGPADIEEFYFDGFRTKVSSS
jgi:WD40 repeat protein